MQFNALSKRVLSHREFIDRQFSALRWLIYQMNKGEKSPAYNEEDFRLFREPKTEEQIAQDIDASIRALSMML